MPAEQPDRFVRAPLAGTKRHRDPMKVVGLGAPVSMAITFHPCEVAVLADAVRGELAAYEQRDPDERGAWADHLGELRAMLDIDARPPRKQFEVVWPTVLAYGVVQRALRLALERVHVAAAGADPDAIAQALAIAAAVFRTARAFDAVDRGGRQEVAL